MLPWTRLVYYLDGQWTGMPVADLYQTMLFARKHKVDYVVREVSSETTGEEVSDSDLVQALPGLEYVDRYRSPSGRYVASFYRVKAEF
jgi:hypothetical protein